MALLKNTIINGNLKVNNDATVNGNVSGNGLNIKDKLLYIPTSVSSLVTIDGDLQTNGLIAADDGLNCNGDLTIDKGYPAYPKCITYITLTQGHKLTLQTPIICSYNAYLLDDIYVTIYSDGYGKILSRSTLTVTDHGGSEIEVKFPVQNINASYALYTITSGKIRHSIDGKVSTLVGSSAITPISTKLTVILEYSPHYTEISITS